MELKLDADTKKTKGRSQAALSRAGLAAEGLQCPSACCLRCSLIGFSCFAGCREGSKQVTQPQTCLRVWTVGVLRSPVLLGIW